MTPQTFDLTLEQQFELRRLEDELQGMSREDAIALLLQSARLLMLKDNVIRNLTKDLLSAK